MSLYGSGEVHTYGAIRNAQILPVFFPGWTLRIYVPSSCTTNDKLKVPPRIISKLQDLGAHIAYVNTSQITIPPRYWSYLVADDEQVDVFLIRKAVTRLSDRDAAAVNLWLHSGHPFHCIRDHPKHSESVFVDGLWGARSQNLRQILGCSMLELLSTTIASLVLKIPDRGSLSFHLESTLIHFGGYDLLHEILWTKLKDYALCHDSVSCSEWSTAQKFPQARSDKQEYLGEHFDMYNQAVGDDRAAFKDVSPQCIRKDQIVGNKTKDVD